MQSAKENSKVTRVGVVMYKFAYKNGVLYRKKYNLIKEDNNIGTFYDLPAGCYTEEMIAFFDGGGKMTSHNVDKIVFYNGFENENFFAIISKDKNQPEVEEEQEKEKDRGDEEFSCTGR